MTVAGDLLLGSIDTLRCRYDAGTVSPVEVVDLVLAELECREPELNAVVTVLAESAREQARDAEMRFLRGEPAPPLAGIPVSVKDVVAVAGVPMTAGSRILRGHRPVRDATAYRRLRQAGAVVFAKTNTLEFAYGFVHPDHGRSNNPWDVSRTAGGSSSGSAASVAAGIGVGSVVTDTGGSARLPAAFCGLTGMKPTYGSIDRSGVIPLAPSLDVVGVITRGVADNALLHRILAGTPAPAGSPPIGAVRLGVVLDLLEEPLADPVRTAFGAGLEALRDAGAHIEEVRLPDVGVGAHQASTIMLAEAAHTHARWYPDRADDYAPGTRANLAAGHDVSAVDYLRALDERARLTARVDDALTHVDVLVCPTIGFTAPEREPDFEGGGPDYIARTIPFSASGHPALTVPAPLADEVSALPVGLQLVTAKNREDVLYRLAAAYETAAGGFPSPVRPRCV